MFNHRGSRNAKVMVRDDCDTLNNNSSLGSGRSKDHSNWELDPSTRFVADRGKLADTNPTRS